MARAPAGARGRRRGVRSRAERWRLVRWWAPVAVVAIAVVAVVAWPTPIVVDERALGGCLPRRHGDAPLGGAVTWLRTAIRGGAVAGADDRRRAVRAAARSRSDRSGRPPPPTTRGPRRLGDDAGAWLQRMFAAERAFAFSVAPEERSVWPAAAAAAGGGFAWPAGATLDAVRANFDVRWVGRERTRGPRGGRDRPRTPPRGPGVALLDRRRDGRPARVPRDARRRARGRRGPGRARARWSPAGGDEPLRAPRAPSDARAAVWGAAFAGLDGFEPVEVARVRLGADVPAVRVTLWDGLSGVVLLVYPSTRNPARGELIVTRTVGALTLALVGPVPEARRRVPRGAGVAALGGGGNGGAATAVGARRRRKGRSVGRVSATVHRGSRGVVAVRCGDAQRDAAPRSHGPAPSPTGRARPQAASARSWRSACSSSSTSGCCSRANSKTNQLFRDT